MSKLIGQTIGQYRIMEQIGRGGMATVYKAFQPAMERHVAIKILPEQLAEDPTFLERFRQEVKAIAQLEHPHILPVYDYGEEHGLTYMVMRYMDSGTLTQRLKQPIEVAEIVRLLGQVAEALDYTHSRGIVHRDIKPGNVLIDPRGEALLTDFGIAKMVEGTTGITRDGVIGTPRYMSPEQAQGRTVDSRSDIYSLGIILYEALVGHPPFEAETPVAVLMMHVNEPLPLPRSLNPSISPALEQVVLKALAKDRSDRYQTAGDMERAMQSALSSTGQGLTQHSAAPVTPASPRTTPATPLPETDGREVGKSNRMSIIIGVALTALILGALLIGGGVAYWAFLSGDGEPLTPSPETVVAIVEDSATNEPTEAPTATVETVVNEPSETPVIEEAGANGELVEPTATTTPEPTPIPPTPADTPTAIATVISAVPATLPPIEPLQAINVTDNPGKSSNPRLVFDDQGILHLVWFDNSRQGENLGDFLHRQKTPDGEWLAAEYLTDDLDRPAAGGADESLRVVRNPAGQICVFWRGNRGTGGPSIAGIYVRCQVDNEWSTAEQVRNTLTLQDFNVDYSLDGTLQLAHTEGGAPATVYINDITLSDEFKNALRAELAIDQAGGYHVVWVRQGDPFSIEYRYSNDNGQSWSEAERLTAETDESASYPHLVADQQGNVHLVFKSPQGIFYRRWTPNTGWGPAVSLNQGSYFGIPTGLTVDAEGLAHVVWDVNNDVYYIQQLADETWSQPRLIAEDINGSGAADVAVDSRGGRHFVWQVKDDAEDLYYATLPIE